MISMFSPPAIAAAADVYFQKKKKKYFGQNVDTDCEQRCLVSCEAFKLIWSL